MPGLRSSGCSTVQQCCHHLQVQCCAQSSIIGMGHMCQVLLNKLHLLS